MLEKINMFIDGKSVVSQSDQWLDVTNPANQEVLYQVPLATHDEIELAVSSAKAAFETWKDVPVPARARMVLQYQHKPTNMHIHYTYFISVVRMHKLLIEVCESLFISVQSSPFSKRLNKYHLYSWLSINKNRTTSNLNALGIINKL